MDMHQLSYDHIHFLLLWYVALNLANLSVLRFLQWMFCICCIGWWDNETNKRWKNEHENRRKDYHHHHHHHLFAQVKPNIPWKKTANVNNFSRTARLNKEHSVLVLNVNEKWTEINLGYGSFKTTQSIIEGNKFYNFYIKMEILRRNWKKLKLWHDRIGAYIFKRVHATSVTVDCRSSWLWTVAVEGDDVRRLVGARLSADMWRHHWATSTWRRTCRIAVTMTTHRQQCDAYRHHQQLHHTGHVFNRRL